METAGILEVSARAAPITTARIRVEPATLATEHRQGTFLVQVDNRHGADTLQVQLAGADEFGRARLTFTPPAMAIASGQVGTARLVVDSPTPPAGKTSSRRLRVSASDGRAAVEAEAVLAQSSPDHRPAVKRWLVVLGALLAMVGALIPWLGEMIDPDSIVRDATNAFGGDASAYAATATAGSTVLVFLLALLMLLGLNGSSGRGIRFAALLMVIVAVAAAAVGADTRGLPLVLLGAVLGFVGGVLARSRGPRYGARRSGRRDDPQGDPRDARARDGPHGCGSVAVVLGVQRASRAACGASSPVPKVTSFSTAPTRTRPVPDSAARRNQPLCGPWADRM